MSWIRSGAFRASLNIFFGEEQCKDFSQDVIFYILPFFAEREHLVFANL